MRSFSYGYLSLLSCLATFFFPTTVLSQELVCFVGRTQNNPFDVSLANAARRKASEIGWNISSYFGQVDGDAVSQISAIEGCIANDASGIIVSPNDALALEDALRVVRDAGIAIVVVGQDISDQELASATMTIDHAKVGEVLGKWINDEFAGASLQRSIAILVPDQRSSHSTEDFQSLNTLMATLGIDAGSSDVIGDESGEGLKSITSVGFTETDIESATNIALSSSDNLNVLIVPNDYVASIATNVVRQAGRGDQVMVIAMISSCQGAKMVQTGEVGATFVENPYWIGSAAVDAIRGSEDGEEVFNGLLEGAYSENGIKLVTGFPIAGVGSIGPNTALQMCYGDTTPLQMPATPTSCCTLKLSCCSMTPQE